MNLRQLRYITELVRQDLNVTRTAAALHTSQPGVSKQVRALEAELGVELFERQGRALVRITPAGEAIIGLARRALLEVDMLREAATEFSEPGRGELSIATTHTQARYALPQVIHAFAERYPAVSLHMHLGTPEQIAEMLASGTADLAIATESPDFFSELVMMPCYRWHRAVVVPEGHPLAGGQSLTLEALAREPLLTYVFGMAPGGTLQTAFNAAGLSPRVAFTATDSEVIKTYVRLGLGVAVIAAMTREAVADEGLVYLDAAHLFEASVTRIGFRRGTFVRRYVYDFIEMFAPHLNRERVETAARIAHPATREALFIDQELPFS